MDAPHTRLGLALIGAGSMGRHHIKTIQESSHFQLSAVIDPNKSQLELLPESVAQHQRYERLETYLRQVTHNDPAVLSGFIIAAPTAFHKNLTETLLPLGKPILLEKPISANSCEANQLIQANSSGRLFIGHVERANPVVRCLMGAVRKQILGEVVHFKSIRRGPYPARLLGQNNVFLDLAVHDLDLLNVIASGDWSVEWAQGQCVRHPRTIDQGDILLHHASGLKASIHASWLSPGRTRLMMLTGTRGNAVVDYIEQRCQLSLISPPLVPLPPEEWQQLTPTEYRGQVLKGLPLSIQLEEFYKAICGEHHGLATPLEGSRALGLAEHAHALALPKD